MALKEAMFVEQLGEGRVQCHLCAHHCVIREDGRGVCQVRENRDGTLYTLVYERAIAQHVDPVEKKPLYHFYPGSLAYSVAAPGCNFRCRWCQNWDISQMPREQKRIMGRETPPEQVVRGAQRHDCRSIAYTYTEPTIFFEYTYDIARLAHQEGIANIYVTNGFMSDVMLEEFHEHLDAANVDLKAFRDDTYRQYMGARLQPVLDSLKLIKEYGIWLEVTTLIVPGLNDDTGELRDAANFIATELGTNTPWHLSRFFPSYEMGSTPPTPETTLRQAYDLGKEAGLNYIYLGNLHGESHTVCHECGEHLVRRLGYQIMRNKVEPSGRCPECGATVPGVGMSGT